MGTDCVDASYEANQDFGSVAAAVEVLNMYRVDASETEIFPGEEQECQVAQKNCCRKAGGGISIGDYIGAARNVISLYSMASGGWSATWTEYANAFTYVLSGGETGSLSGLLGNTISDFLGTTTSTLYSSPGVVSYETATKMGVTVTQEGITEVTMVSAELISTLATLATVVTIALTVYSILKMVWDWYFQCEREDIITSSKLQLHLCHYVGKKQKGKFLGLWRKVNAVYCCFNSILARIVHEQGRPQIGIGWGTAKAPNCRGFTPEELASIDFSQVDLSEYMQYVLHKTDISPEEAEEIANKIKEKYLQ
jgi:conjugal transfer mating pair stabilization protein TraN